MERVPIEVIAVITPLLTAATSLAGILISSKLTQWRIEQLEKRVEKHNNVIERTAVAENSLKVCHHRVDDIRDELEELKKKG